jgi:hypothetical protein
LLPDGGAGKLRWNGSLSRIAIGVRHGKTAKRIESKNPLGNFCRVVILEVVAFSWIICLTAMSHSHKPLIIEVFRLDILTETNYQDGQKARQIMVRRFSSQVVGF